MSSFNDILNNLKGGLEVPTFPLIPFSSSRFSTLRRMAPVTSIYLTKNLKNRFMNRREIMLKRFSEKPASTWNRGNSDVPRIRLLIPNTANEDSFESSRRMYLMRRSISLTSA